MARTRRDLLQANQQRHPDGSALVRQRCGRAHLGQQGRHVGGELGPKLPVRGSVELGEVRGHVPVGQGSHRVPPRIPIRSDLPAAVISAGMRPAAARKGASSIASRRSRGWPKRGSARWLSSSVSPWPGKCLPQESSPPDSSPSEKAAAWAGVSRLRRNRMMPPSSARRTAASRTSGGAGHRGSQLRGPALHSCESTLVWSPLVPSPSSRSRSLTRTRFGKDTLVEPS